MPEGLRELFLGRTRAQLVDDERNATLVEQRAECKAAWAATNYGDSWLNRCHLFG